MALGDGNDGSTGKGIDMDDSPDEMRYPNIMQMKDYNSDLLAFHSLLLNVVKCDESPQSSRGIVDD